MTEPLDLLLQFLDGETDKLPKGEPQYKLQMLALRIERADRKQDMLSLQTSIDNNTEKIKKFINGNGFEDRLKTLEEKEKKREDKKKENKTTYWQPLVSGLIGASTTLIVAWIAGLLH